MAPRLKALCTKVTPAERSMLDALARLEGTTTSNLVRRLLVSAVRARMKERVGAYLLCARDGERLKRNVTKSHRVITIEA